jgi:hypothetical protein
MFGSPPKSRVRSVRARTRLTAMSAKNHDFGPTRYHRRGVTRSCRLIADVFKGTFRRTTWSRNYSVTPFEPTVTTSHPEAAATFGKDKAALGRAPELSGRQSAVTTELCKLERNHRDGLIFSAKPSSCLTSTSSVARRRDWPRRSSVASLRGMQHVRPRSVSREIV